jgi:hypothetical protein
VPSEAGVVRESCEAEVTEKVATEVKEPVVLVESPGMLRTATRAPSVKISVAVSNEGENTV